MGVYCLIGVGSLLFFLSFCGIYGSCKRSKMCLSCYSLGIIALMAIFASIAILIAIFFTPFIEEIQ